MALTSTLPDNWASSLPSYEAADSQSLGLAHEDPGGRAYNEVAFRYFLHLEEKRWKRDGQSFVLLLVDVPGLNQAGRFPRKAAAKVFAVMARHLRAADLLGWYTARQVLGAVLIHHDGVDEREIEQTIEARFGSAIREALGNSVHPRLRVRIFAGRQDVGAVPWP